MDMINRIKTVVTQVLPVGNPITNDFELVTQRASGGPSLAWKIHDAINKTTRQEASVFIFEKKWLERLHSRRDREMFVEMLRRGVLQLTKLRHPNILSIVHPLEDSRESLAFATEPLFTSLSNVIGYHDNLSNPPPKYLKDFKLFEVETKYGLLQMIEGLSFLHKGARIIHGNLNPECVFINKLGTWKLAGFEHAILNGNAQGEPYYPYREFNQHSDPLSQPKLHYLAPEFGLSGCCDISSDIFSFGMLLYALYNSGGPLNQSTHDWKSYKLNASDLRNLRIERLSEVPSDIRDVLKLMLNIDPAVRPDADQLTKTTFFDDVGVVTLTYLDLLVQKDNLQKSQFFKDLAPVVAKLPKRVNLQRVVPSLANEASNSNMVPFILPTIFQVAMTTTNEEYQHHIFPVFIPLFKITDPVQVTLLFLQNMELMLQKSSQNDIRNHILSLVSRALEINIPQIQDLCLRSMSTFATIAESSSMKNTIIPKMLRLALSSAPLGIRVNCLVCLGKILEHLDRWFVMDEVLPAVMTIRSREPAVLMSELGIFKTAMTHPNLGISKEMLASKLIPHLFPISIDNTLNLKQFNAYMCVIKEMMEKVETEHRSKLQQLDTVQQEQKSLQRFAQEVTDSQANPVVQSSSSSDSLSFLEAPLATHPTKSARTTSKKLLTLEEKESLAKQQELQLRFQTNPTITPLNPSTPTRPPPSTPINLTHSLIDNNLAKMKLSSHNHASSHNHSGANYQPFTNHSTNQPFTNHSTNQAFSNHSTNHPFTNHSTNQPFTNQSNNQINYQPFNDLSTNQPFGNQLLLSQSNNWMGQSAFNQPINNKTRVDTSAFDSINTGLVSKPTNRNLPMATMPTNHSTNRSMSTNQSQFTNNFSNQSPAMNFNPINLQSEIFSKNSNQPNGISINTNQSNLSSKDIQDLLG